MSEQEFELYLELLGRLMRLSPQQREAVAYELRDHLEERFAELLAQGLPRREAVVQALAEFGEAHLLAQEFSRLAQERRRRLIMRCTLASGLVLAVVLLVSVAFWPAGAPRSTPSNAVAQQQPAPQPPKGAAGKKTPSRRSLMAERFAYTFKRQQEQRDVIEESLQRDVDFDLGRETTLSDFFALLRDRLQINIVVGLDHEGLEHFLDQSILKKKKTRGLTYKETLAVVLHPEGLDFRVAPGYLFISSAEQIRQTYEVRIYDVGDLVENDGELTDLANLVRAVVEPELWGQPVKMEIAEPPMLGEKRIREVTYTHKGGGGRIVTWRKRYLIVTHCYPVQEKVGLFLEQLRHGSSGQE